MTAREQESIKPMDPFFERFDRIFIINLKERADRRREIDHQLRRVGLSIAHEKVEIFDAVRPADAGAFPSIGARGCFLSHLGIQKAAQEAGLSTFLVLEDDADFVGECTERLSMLSERLDQKPWDIFYLGGNFVRPEDSGEGLATLQPDEPVLTTHAMAFTSRAASKLVPHLEAMLHRPAGSEDGGPMHVDGALSWFRKDHASSIETVVASPPLMIQRPSKSDIFVSGRWIDRLPFAGVVRRLKR